MKIIAPSYYLDFKCKAAECRHSCCIGWEIDVDDDTLAVYQKISSSIGEKIRQSIDYSDAPHFRLTEDERCPHLARSGLCNIITECGEAALCQICRDHPRYRNYYNGVVEFGLGLSCEEAAGLATDREATLGFLVSDSENMTDAVLYREYPAELFSKEERPLAEEKKRLLSIVSDREQSIEKRFATLFQYTLKAEEIKSLYLSLESLDAGWKNKLELLSAENFGLKSDDFALYAEKILTEFIYRHTTSDGFREPRIIAAFAALSACIVIALAKTPDEVPDVLRAYSAEIEYSLENTERILDFIEEMHLH